jgi:hypothetical protein
MVEERFEDLRGDPHHISFHGWRCVCCGNITDPVIVSNRLKPVAPVTGVPGLALLTDTVRTLDLGIRAA